MPAFLPTHCTAASPWGKRHCVMGMPMQILLCYPSFSCLTCLLHPCCKEPKASHALGPQPEVSSLSAGHWSRLSCLEWRNMQVCANQVVEGFSVPLIFVSPEFNKFLLKNKNLAAGLLKLQSFLSACVNWAAIGFSTAWGLFQQDKNPYNLLNTNMSCTQGDVLSLDHFQLHIFCPEVFGLTRLWFPLISVGCTFPL